MTTTKKVTTVKTVKNTKKTSEKIMEEKLNKLEEKANEQQNIEDERLAKRKEQREKRKLFNDNLEILLFCNAGNTEVIFKTESQGHTNTYVMTFGDTQWVTFNELRQIKNTSMLKNYILKPIDINIDELTLEDVLQELGIQDLYEDEEMLYEDNLNYILNGLDYNKFKLYVDSVNPRYLNRIVDLAIEQAKKGGFSDANKRMYLEKILNKRDMFSEAIRIELE